MKLSCDIVMDLVGIYKDKLASADSVKAINEHLKECPECRRFYRNYNPACEIRYEEPAEETDSYSDYNYSDVSKRLRKTHNRNLLIMSVIAGAAATITAVNLIKMFGNQNDK